MPADFTSYEYVLNLLIGLIGKELHDFQSRKNFSKIIDEKNYAQILLFKRC